ncbi:hypothetical protein JCM10207_003415 [Rhodosporidiobolus poonsookiae]
MGVQDLTKVIKKLAPSAIRPVPSLRSFAGSRVAIDANLLSTKFFFAARRGAPPLPLTREAAEEEGRKLAQQWYWFVVKLRKEGIRPIVVFDGETRVKEKERENERRRKVRELQRLRGVAEGERGGRLREIREVWGQVKDGERREVANTFRAEAARLQVDARTTEAAAGPSSRAQLAQPHSPRPAVPSTPAAALLTLYRSFLADSTNPIYSKNQQLITTEEQSFFASLLSGRAVEQLAAPTAPPSIDEVTSCDDTAVEGERLTMEELETAEWIEEELQDVIRRSDKLGASHMSRSIGPPKEAFREVRALIHALGVPYLEPSPSDPHEAEGVCSALHAVGLADYVVSEDTDVAVYGAPMIRRITTSDGFEGARARKSKGKEPMVVLEPDELRRQLGLTKEEMVDFALLCGTDFTERIPFLGPVTALKLIRELHTIEAILAAHGDKFKPVGGDVAAYLQTVRDARAIFLTLPRLPLSTSPSAASDVTLTPPDAATASTFAGSLDLRPPAPELKQLLERIGVRRLSKFMAYEPPQAATRSVVIASALAAAAQLPLKDAVAPSSTHSLLAPDDEVDGAEEADLEVEVELEEEWVPEDGGEVLGEITEQGGEVHGYDQQLEDAFERMYL